MLAHYPPYPRWHTTHANTLPTPPKLPTQPHHPCYHAIHAGTNSTPYLKLFSNAYQIVTGNFLKENLSSKNLPIKNSLPDNKVHEEILLVRNLPYEICSYTCWTFYLYPFILPKCAFIKRRVKKLNSSVLVSKITVLMNLPCDLPIWLYVRNK